MRKTNIHRPGWPKFKWMGQREGQLREGVNLIVSRQSFALAEETEQGQEVGGESMGTELQN